jgi:hypothetical protein
MILNRKLNRKLNTKLNTKLNRKLITNQSPINQYTRNATTNETVIRNTIVRTMRKKPKFIIQFSEHVTVKLVTVKLVTMKRVTVKLGTVKLVTVKRVTVKRVTVKRVTGKRGVFTTWLFFLNPWLYARTLAPDRDRDHLLHIIPILIMCHTILCP